MIQFGHFIGGKRVAGNSGRASDVFGAMPSLHVAYALIVALEGWAVFGVGLRIASVVFYLTMGFSAVYLDHHWVLDAVAGSTYSIVVAVVARWVGRRWRVEGASRASAFQDDAGHGGAS